jgi:ADP-ribosylglycohydrolase
MLGAIAGDIIGSLYEGFNIRSVEFPLFGPGKRFTDDTVLTVALADSILYGDDYPFLLKWYYRQYPRAGFGSAFQQWARSDSLEPYNSWGNGSAMRVSPVGWAYDTLAEVLEQAERSASATHNHPEGIKGAQAIAGAVFLARTGSTKDAIKAYIEDRFGYALDDTIDNLRGWYKFDVSCQGSVPQALIAFLESDNYEDCVRKAISIGGDSDTIACMAGGIAHAFYGPLPDNIKREVYARLDEPLTEVVFRFCEKFDCG